MGPQGAAGKDGANGRTILSGEGPPSPSQGADGDFYLDQLTTRLYGPKAEGAWPTEGTSLVGQQGPAGPQGPVGPQGAAGKDGANGRTILSGEGPPSPGQGADGDFYLDQLTHELYGPKLAGAWPGEGVSLQGAQGVTGATGADGKNGADGRTVLSGAGAPTPGLGSDGDFYVDTSTYDIYGPKLAGTWGTATSLKGPQGASGAQGPQGPQGLPGAQGPQGPAGPAGPATMIVGGGGSGTNPSIVNESFAGLFMDVAAANRGSAQQRVPSAGTLSQFSFSVSSAPGSGKSWKATVEVNGGSSGVSCEITGTSTGCTDLVNSATFAAGDLISIRINPLGGPGTASPVRWSALFTAG